MSRRHSGVLVTPQLTHWRAGLGDGEKLEEGVGEEESEEEKEDDGEDEEKEEERGEGEEAGGLDSTPAHQPDWPL